MADELETRLRALESESLSGEDRELLQFLRQEIRTGSDRELFAFMIRVVRAVRGTLWLSNNMIKYIIPPVVALWVVYSFGAEWALWAAEKAFGGRGQ